MNHVEFIGGNFRIPFFNKYIQKSYGSQSKIADVADYIKNRDVEPLQTIIGTMNPDETIANGAATYGWLLQNPEITKKINFTRVVREKVFIRYPNKSNSQPYIDVKVFDISKINTTFFDSDTYSETDSETDSKTNSNHTQYDQRSIEIPMCDTFKILIGSFELKVNLKHSTVDDKSDSCNKIYVKLRYGLNNMVDIISICDNNNNIEYELVTINTHSININQLIEYYHKIESDIRNSEKNIEDRQNFINFMEAYYFDKDKVNKLMNIIANDFNRRDMKIGVKFNGKLDVNHVYNSQFSSPLKEVYEFYQFCRSYCEDAITDDQIEKKQRVENILNDTEAIKGLLKAVQIIINIQDTYKE